MSNSPRPGIWALERSNDHGKTYTPWQYFAGNLAECYTYFNMLADQPITRDDQVSIFDYQHYIATLNDLKYHYTRINVYPNYFYNVIQVICSTEFSKVLPIEDGEVYVSLTTGRPSAGKLTTESTELEVNLHDFIYSSYLEATIVLGSMNTFLNETSFYNVIYQRS